MYIRYSSSAIRHPPCVGVKRNFSYRPVADLSHMYIRYSSSAIRHPPCVGVKRNFSYRPVADLSLSHCICCPRHNIPKAFSLNAGALLFWHTHNLNGYIGWCGCHEILISLSSTKESLLPRSKKSQLHRNFQSGWWEKRSEMTMSHELETQKNWLC